MINGVFNKKNKYYSYMMTQHKQSGLKIVPPVKCDLEEVAVKCVLCVWSILLCGAVGGCRAAPGDRNQISIGAFGQQDRMLVFDSRGGRERSTWRKPMQTRENMQTPHRSHHRNRTHDLPAVRQRVLTYFSPKNLKFHLQLIAKEKRTIYSKSPKHT